MKLVNYNYNRYRKCTNIAVFASHQKNLHLISMPCTSECYTFSKFMYFTLWKKFVNYNYNRDQRCTNIVFFASHPHFLHLISMLCTSECYFFSKRTNFKMPECGLNLFRNTQRSYVFAICLRLISAAKKVDEKCFVETIWTGKNISLAKVWGGLILLLPDTRVRTYVPEHHFLTT